MISIRTPADGSQRVKFVGSDELWHQMGDNVVISLKEELHCIIEGAMVNDGGQCSARDGACADDD